MNKNLWTFSEPGAAVHYQARAYPYMSKRELKSCGTVADTITWLPIVQHGHESGSPSAQKFFPGSASAIFFMQIRNTASSAKICAKHWRLEAITDPWNFLLDYSSVCNVLYIHFSNAFHGFFSEWVSMEISLQSESPRLLSLTLQVLLVMPWTIPRHHLHSRAPVPHSEIAMNLVSTIMKSEVRLFPSLCGV